MKEIKEMYDVRYSMMLCGGGDIWRFQGIIDGETRWTSCPVHYDRESRILTTRSGSRYQLVNFDGNEQQIIEQIETDIKHGGFEIH